MSDMTSSRPYLIRAMYQWVSDNGLTAYVLVDASVEDCMVPVNHIQDGKIILNIAPMAVTGLVLGDDDITFSARFSGKAESIYVPIDSVLAIYAKENGQGMMFSEENSAVVNKGSDDNGSDPDPETPPTKPSGSHLRVVK